MKKQTDQRKKALEALGINPDHRLILSLDGGGIRGILTLQMLKKIEEIAGIPCFELFDMVAGTSTGGIIAGLIASGKNAIEIESLYVKLVRKVFKKRNWRANRFVNPPLYDKVNYRTALKQLVANSTLEDACIKTNIDLLITAKDVSAGEEIFFTCFKNGENTSGTYRAILLRAAMEATMSAPTYFSPLERFVDGGTTTYNNPTLSAVMEAVHYCPDTKYKLNELTLFSFGTGTSIDFIKPKEAMNPEGLDAAFWLNFVMRESSQDASTMQINLIRSGLIPGMDFRRFQISFDQNAMKKLPNRDISHLEDLEANTLWDLTDEELKGVELDDVQKFDLMKAIGDAMVEYIMSNEKGGKFKTDLTNEKKRDQLVTTFGDVDIIKNQMSNPRWLDEFQS